MTNVYQHRLPADLYDVLFIVHATGLWEIPSAAIDSSNLSLAGTHPRYGDTRWDRFKLKETE